MTAGVCVRRHRLVLTAAAGFAAALLLAGGGAFGYSPAPSSTWVVSGGSPALGGGSVNATAVAGSTAYVGGNFGYIGPPTGSAAAFDTSTAAMVKPWPAVTGTVYAVAADGADGWYLGGDFDSVGTAERSNLVHVQSDGTVDSGWSAGTNDTVFSLVVSGSNVYAGGSFTEAGGQSRLRLAAFDKTTGALVNAFTANVTGTAPATTYVRTLLVLGSKLYVGGSFTQVGGTGRNNLAGVDLSSGSSDASFNPNVNGVVRALATVGGDVYAGGTFTQVNGGAHSRARLAAFDGTSGIAESWNPGPASPVSADTAVNALAVSGATVFVGGSFDSIGSPASQRHAVAAINVVTGNVVSSWDPFIRNPQRVDSIVVSGSTVYVGGFFQTLASNDSVSRDNLVAVNIGDGGIQPFHPVVGGAVYGLAVNGDASRIAVGGAFRSAGFGPASDPSPSPVRRDNLGAIDLTTGKPTDWAPYADDTVNAVAVAGTRVYAGGSFRNVASTGDAATVPRLALAAFDATTAEVGSWDPALSDGIVNAVAVSGSTVYAGGTFTEVFDGLLGEVATRNRLASFAADDDGFVTAWDPNVNGSVDALAVGGSTVYAGGAFTTVNGGTTRNRLAAFDSSGTATVWDPDVADGEVNAIAVNGSTVYVGGSFTQVNGTTPRFGAAAFTTGGDGPGEFSTRAGEEGTATPWNPHLTKVGGGHGTANALAASGTAVYLGGDFDFIGPCPVCVQGAAGAVTTGDGEAIPSWLPEPNATVNAVALAQTGVVLGGSFTAVGYPRPGAPHASPEAGAAARGGFAAFLGLPEPPSGVSASPRDRGATISFTPSEFTGGGSVIYTATSNPGNLTFQSSDSPIEAVGLTNGVDYTFTLTATNSVGTSQPVSSNTVTPTAAPAAPAAPSGVTGTPGDGQASVSFTPGSDGGSPVTDYTVTSSPGGFTGSGSGSPITVGGLTNGTAYTFTVRATNDIGTSPASAASTPVTPRTVPGAPTIGTATPGNGQVTVSFSAPASSGGAAVTSYTVTSTPGSISASGGGSPITVTGLTNGVAYTFTVTATNPAGVGSASAASSAATPRTVPNAPVNVSAVPGNGGAIVLFGPPSSDGGAAVTTYTVTAYNAAGTAPTGQSAAGSTSPIAVPGLTNDTAYTFKVKATNVAGAGPESTASNSVTPSAALTAPGAPTSVSATGGNGLAIVTFGPPATTGGTPVLRYTVTASPGGRAATTTGSPVVVDGLANGTSYTFTVTATNAVGTGPASQASPPVTPQQPPRAGAPAPPAAQPRPPVPTPPVHTGPRTPPARP